MSHCDSSEHYFIKFNIKYNKKEYKYKILNLRDVDLINANLCQKLFIMNHSTFNLLFL